MSQNKISVADHEHMVGYIEWYITSMVHYIKYIYAHLFMYTHLPKLY